LRLELCPAEKQEKPKKHMHPKYIPVDVVLPLLLGFILLSSTISCTTKRSKRTMQLHFSASASKHFLPKVSYKELFNAIGGSSQANIVGQGTFGNVYWESSEQNK